MPPVRLEQTRPTGNGRARGLVSSRTSGQRVQAHTYAAPDSLSDVVAAYWTGRWDLRGQAPHVTEILNDPCFHFAFESGGTHHAGARVVGIWTRLWRRQLEGQGRVRGVKVRAGAARAFLDTPAFRFRCRVVPLVEVFGDVEGLVRTVLEADDDAEAFGAVGAWLLARRRHEDSMQVSLAVALVERIVTDPAITTVEKLAEVAGVSPRGLQRLFREHVGATPKWVIRRNRLQEAALRIERGEGGTLAMLAATLGYADQAHFARDFKSAVGKSPTVFASTLKG